MFRHTSTATRFLAAAALACGIAPIGAAAAEATTADPGSTLSSRACDFDPQYLPRTPDAVEGWYASCLARSWHQLRRVTAEGWGTW